MDMTRRCKARPRNSQEQQKRTLIERFRFRFLFFSDFFVAFHLPSPARRCRPPFKETMRRLLFLFSLHVVVAPVSADWFDCWQA